MTGSIAPNRPGHHGTVVARTVGTVAISCNGGEFLEFSKISTAAPDHGLIPVDREAKKKLRDVNKYWFLATTRKNIFTSASVCA